MKAHWTAVNMYLHKERISGIFKDGGTYYFAGQIPDLVFF